tara:strand:- start:342 stop:788 length:447 start_codon:yes stop_codon:yes gene_type:complete
MGASEKDGSPTKFYLPLHLICSSLVLCTVYFLDYYFDLNLRLFDSHLSLILTFAVVHTILAIFVFKEEDEGDYFEPLNRGFYMSDHYGEILEMSSGVLLHKGGEPFTGNAFGPDRKLRHYRKGVLVGGVLGFILRSFRYIYDPDGTGG